MEIVCPKPAALPDVFKSDCPENFGQIQRFLFQRQGHVFDSTLMVSPNSIKLLASWTPLLTAVDDTKVISTPKMANVIIPKATPKKEGGGDNTTIDGIEVIVGVGPITLTGDLISIPAKTILQLKTALGPEEDLEVFMINQYGQIIGWDIAPDAPGTKVKGLQTAGRVFVGDAGNEGYATLDKAIFTFSFAEGWRDQCVLIKPTDFNAKTALFVSAP